MARAQKFLQKLVPRYTMVRAQKLPGTFVTLVPEVIRSPELLRRWMQYSSLADAVFRTHPGTLPDGGGAQAWDDDMIPHLKKWAEVFAKGAAYRKAVGKSQTTGEALPILRFGALVWNSPVSRDGNHGGQLVLQQHTTILLQIIIFRRYGFCMVHLQCCVVFDVSLYRENRSGLSIRTSR